MDIAFNCLGCGQSIVIEEAGRGQTFDCPKCGGKVEVPQSDPAPSSLRECPDCKKQISIRALTCPSCGAPVKTARNEKNRKAVAVIAGLIGLVILFCGGWRAKNIGDECLDLVGLGSSGFLDSWQAGTVRDFSDSILMPTETYSKLIDENFERFRRGEKEVSIDHLQDDYKTKIQRELDDLQREGRKIAGQAVMYGGLFLIVSWWIWTKRRIV